MMEQENKFLSLFASVPSKRSTESSKDTTQKKRKRVGVDLPQDLPMLVRPYIVACAPLVPSRPPMEDSRIHHIKHAKMRLEMQSAKKELEELQFQKASLYEKLAKTRLEMQIAKKQVENLKSLYENQSETLDVCKIRLGAIYNEFLCMECKKLKPNTSLWPVCNHLFCLECLYNLIFKPFKTGEGSFLNIKAIFHYPKIVFDSCIIWTKDSQFIQQYQMVFRNEWIPGSLLSCPICNNTTFPLSLFHMDVFQHFTPCNQVNSLPCPTAFLCQCPHCDMKFPQDNKLYSMQKKVDHVLRKCAARSLPCPFDDKGECKINWNEFDQQKPLTEFLHDPQLVSLLMFHLKSNRCKALSQCVKCKASLPPFQYAFHIVQECQTIPDVIFESTGWSWDKKRIT